MHAEHATNEQMALLMGWHEESSWWFTEQGTYSGFTNDNAGAASRKFRPTTDLNHAALVEARLDDLGLKMQYMRSLTELLKDERGRSSAWGFATAKAQTRCDAAWATWQQRAKE